MSLQSNWGDKTYPRTDISQRYRHMTVLIKSQNKLVSFSELLKHDFLHGSFGN